MLRDWGQERKYHHVFKGYNYRMEGMQGAILRVKLRHLEAWTETRRARAARYDELFRDTGVQTPTVVPYARHVYHIYGVRVPHRDGLQQGLQSREIQTGIHYPIPVHLLPAYADLSYAPGDFPCSEHIAAEELSLPIYPELQESTVRRISEYINNDQLIRLALK